MKKSFLIIFLSLSILISYASAQENLIQLKAVIHLSSSISEGEYTPVQIAQIAKDEGISIVIFTERDLMRWEYGFWPLRNLIKRRVEHNSIFTYGIKRYLREIETLQNKFSDMILIPGAESAPFYYWQGSPSTSAFILGRRPLYKEGEFQDFRRELRERLYFRRKGLSSSLEAERMRMYNWHAHILTIGLQEYEDYRNLPVTGNYRGLNDGFNIFMLWPLLTLILGLWRAKTVLYWYVDHKGRHLGIYSKKWLIISVATVLVSFPFILNNWPFYRVKFDQYHGDLKNLPYQNYIDYVNERGGVTFWAHPEAENIEKVGDIGFVTQKHSHYLLDIKNYTGFSFFPEGSREVGSIGGVWDELLMAYCRGLRDKPIWAIGGLAFERGNLRQSMRSLQTIMLVSKESKSSVLEALKKGRMYIVSGEDSLAFSLEEFYLSDETGKVRGYAGDSVKIEGKPALFIRGDFLKGQREIEIRIIKDGKVVKTYDTQTPFRIVYCEDSATQKKSYYRMEIIGKGLHLVTNPVFIH